MASKLTPKQEQFVREYLVDLNATQAAIRAGYSAQTATVTGAKLLANAKVTAAVQKAMKAREKRTDITADRVLQELARIGFSDIGHFVEYGPAGVTIKPSEGVDTKVLSEVSEKTTKDGKVIAFKLHDKVNALDKLGRHLGLFKDKVEVTGKDGGPVEVAGKPNLKSLTREELAALVQIRAKLYSGGVDAQSRSNDR